jgi:hypothetical protein
MIRMSCFILSYGLDARPRSERASSNYEAKCTRCTRQPTNPSISANIVRSHLRPFRHRRFPPVQPSQSQQHEERDSVPTCVYHFAWDCPGANSSTCWGIWMQVRRDPAQKACSQLLSRETWWCNSPLSSTPVKLNKIKGNASSPISQARCSPRGMQCKDKVVLGH